MPTSALVKFESFLKDVHEKKHDLSSDTLKWVLTNTAPDVASDTVLTDITEISAGNGYTSGGSAATISSSTQTSGTYKLVLADVEITASGGDIGPFRYAVLYNDTSASDLLIGYVDYGSSITVDDGGSYTLDCDPSTGVYQCEY